MLLTLVWMELCYQLFQYGAAVLFNCALCAMAVFYELLFMHFGLSGPYDFSSSYWLSVVKLFKIEFGFKQSMWVYFWRSCAEKKSHFML